MIWSEKLYSVWVTVSSLLRQLFSRWVSWTVHHLAGILRRRRRRMILKLVRCLAEILKSTTTVMSLILLELSMLPLIDFAAGEWVFSSFSFTLVDFMLCLVYRYMYVWFWSVFAMISVFFAVIFIFGRFRVYMSNSFVYHVRNSLFRVLAS